jgi:hypothetical protein
LNAVYYERKSLHLSNPLASLSLPIMLNSHPVLAGAA